MIKLNVHGVKVLVQSEDKDFQGMVRGNYSVFEEDYKENSDINIDFIYGSKEGKRLVTLDDTWHKIGSTVYYREKEIYTNMYYVEVHAQYENEKLKISSQVKVPASKSFRRKLTGRTHRKYNELLYAMRTSVHFPIFWFLERKRGMCLMHASAVTDEKNTLIFVGLDGSGKTSLALHKLSSGYRFMTDNFLLFDSKKLYAFPEAVRLEREMAERLGFKPDSKEIFGKLHFTLPKEKIALEAVPTAVFFTYFGKKTEVKEVSLEYLDSLLPKIHDYLQEFHSYSYLSVLDIILADNKRRPDLSRTLNALLSNAKCFVLVKSKKDSVESASELLESYL